MSVAASGGPHASPGFWLHHAALTWRQACEARLGDITYPQFNVLSAVSLLAADGGGPPTQQDVARFARMDRMMTSKLIHTLEGRGLLKRSPDSADGRRWRLMLTPGGRSAVRACVAAAHRADDEIFGTGPDRDQLRDALRAIAEKQEW